MVKYTYGHSLIIVTTVHLPSRRRLDGVYRLDGSWDRPGVDLNDYLVRHKPATFMFNVRGDSMRGASIEDGDKVVVDRSLQARHNMVI